VDSVFLLCILYFLAKKLKIYILTTIFFTKKTVAEESKWRNHPTVSKDARIEPRTVAAFALEEDALHAHSARSRSLLQIGISSFLKGIVSRDE
jgi:hypothetical protein